MEPSLQIEDRANGVRVLTLHNEAKRNALDDSLLEALAAALEPAATAQVRALLIRGGGGKAFCSGYDLVSLASPPEHGPLPDARLMEVLELLQSHPAPSVALVEGAAFGAGCDLAAACDFRIGTDETVFCMPPSRLGVVYAPEGLMRLSALCGPAFAKRMFFTGRRVDAETALRVGLLDEKHSKLEASGFAGALCDEIAAGAPLSVRGMKRAFHLLAKSPLAPHEAQELALLRREAFTSEDTREGRAAFLEKRPPRFSGR